MKKMSAAVASHLIASANLKMKIAENEELLAVIAEVSQLCITALKQGRKIMFAGNGGSAADAQHLAAEFVSRFEQQRGPLPAMALTTDSSILTAIANDYGVEHLFERQVYAHGQEGDILFLISTSGSSGNILKAVEAAKACGVITVAMTAEQGVLRDLCHFSIEVPDDNTARIQEAHISIGHVLCRLTEAAMAAEQRKGLEE